MKLQWPEKKWEKIIYAIVSSVYTLCLLYIFFFTSRRWEYFPKRKLNLSPFGYKIRYLKSYHVRLSPEWIEFFKDLVGNVVVFMPLPFLFAYFLGIKSWKRLLLMSASLSFAIELTQFVFKIGMADIDDLLLNTAGAAIGLLIMRMIAIDNVAQTADKKDWQRPRKLSRSY